MKPRYFLLLTIFSALVFTLLMPLISAHQSHVLSAKILQLSIDDYHHHHNNNKNNKNLVGNKHEHKKFNRRMLEESLEEEEEEEGGAISSANSVYTEKTVYARRPMYMYRHGFSLRSVPSLPNPIQNRYPPGSGC